MTEKTTEITESDDKQPRRNTLRKRTSRCALCGFPMIGTQGTKHVACKTTERLARIGEGLRPKNKPKRL
jgi:hypothetical protein